MKVDRTRVATLVREGLAAQQGGDPVRAAALYRQALALDPEQPAALQLLGLLARRGGDAVAAEDLMRRSLRAQPAQPHVWNNLGNLLDSLGRRDEAEACFDRALTLDAGYADAHYNRARVLRAAGRLSDAAAALQRALELVPQASVGMLQLQAQIEADAGAVDAALATLDRALQLAPERPALLHNRATLLQRSHRHAEALQVHERALALGLDAADAHYNLGNTLQSLGRHDDAVRAYRAALARDPVHRLALFDLARLRWRLGDPDFDVDLREAARLDPASPAGPALRGQLLLRAGRHAEAGQAWREAVRRAPAIAAHHDGLGQSLVRVGAIDEGLAAHAQAVLLAPADAQVHANHAASLLAVGHAAAAAAAAGRSCELAPDNQSAWSLLGLAWRLQGDAREAWLNDYEHFVAVVDLAPPPGWPDMDAFCLELAQELRQLHRDRAPPVDQTLRGGTQTLGDIFEQGHPLVDALKARIGEAIDRHIAALPDDPRHPFLRRRAARWRYTDSWSSRLLDRGFHTNHVHPHGWISSAFYVVVPAASVDPARRQGWLQFGEPDFDVGLSDPVRLRVGPRPGRLALFPSYFWHGTTAFDAGERLTIAFDVKPA